MFKILKRVGDRWWLFIPITLSIVINVLMDLLLPIQLSYVIADLQANEGVKAIFIDCLWMLLFAFVSGLSAILTCKFASLITSHAISKTRYELYKRVGEFSIEEMNQFSVSSLVTRTTNDLTFVSNSLNIALRFLGYGPLLSLSALIFLMCRGAWTMVGAIIAAIVLMIVFIIIIVVVVMPKYRSIQAKLDKVSLVTRENLEGLRVVRAYNAEKYQEEKFANDNHELMKTDAFSNKGLNFLTPVIQLIFGLLNTAIYVIGSYIIPGSTTFDYSALSGVVQFAAIILTGFIMLIAAVIQLPRAVVCAQRVNEVIETIPHVQGQKESPEIKEKGTIEFKDVSFAYPGAEKPVLEHISFKVNKGETIAFIGATGSGKTTLINLLPRFFDATSGEVLIDDVNVKDYNLQDLCSRFGYVPQKGYLFHDSLVNNITIGKPNATPVEIKRALEISQSSDFVSKLPGGMEYEISQGGKNVSGGQRQRLCIARAIIMNPEIFIFDDSFSALDYRTDKILRGEIKAKCQGTTNVIVAQRVGTIIDADQIIVLDEGKMVGKGTHKELLANCPVYKEIALSQLSKEELENGTSSK